MRNHRRNDGRKAAKKLRIIFSNEQVDARAARGNDDVPVALAELLFIFALDQRGSNSGLLRVSKTEPDQGFSQRLEAALLKIGHKRWRKARNYGMLSHKQRFYALRSVRNLLGVLRADNEALAAENALLADDMRLIGGEANRVDRAVANALIAVFAVRLFQF
ncbi:hypothetical protein SDC9_99595 [bioreactor metagenome]|uniref:Uncharacterized protein n=1 Tax=bioreactor metagenome TaxID=1076179 RepID=A0A645AHZ0_9ZZZZ